MKFISRRLLLLVLALLCLPVFAAEKAWVVYEGKSGPGTGKHIVLVAGDEEYRSEEGLPQLAKILSQRHGFKCTMIFPVDPKDGSINPDIQNNLPGIAALDSADLCLMLLRFRNPPEEQMRHFIRYLAAGKPIIGLRTSTHAFNYKSDSPFKSFNNFGREVLGENWVSHWGRHKVEACLGVIEKSAADHAILRGVGQIFGDSDVYEAAPPADAKILVWGQVLKGMKPEDPPADYVKKTRQGVEQRVNEPMMPVVWLRDHKNEAGKVNKIVNTTMGAATDLQSEGLRRLVVNSAFWTLGLEVPAKANVDYIGDYKPTMFGFKTFVKGVKPADHELK